MTNAIYSQDYLQYQTGRSRIRKAVRRIYLWHVRRATLGKVLDFGCGAGEHLATFPAGSMGLEVNESAVQYCRAKGLNVLLYDPVEDDYRLLDVPAGIFTTLIISHVLEHLNSPEAVLRKLFAACRRIGIRRIFITVPCEAGFRHDKTHRTFIDQDFVLKNQLDRQHGFHLQKSGYFPFNSRHAGRFFTYNEFYWICDDRG